MSEKVHITTETDHPKHVVAIGGVGLTETDLSIATVLASLPAKECSTAEVHDEMHDASRDRTQTRRGLKRLERAGVVDRREVELDTRVSGFEASQWWFTEKALDRGIVERLRENGEKPLDPVEERDQRIEKLERTIDDLADELEQLRARLNDVENAGTDGEERRPPDPWDGVNDLR